MMKSLKFLTATALLVGSLPVSAGFMMGHGYGGSDVLETVIEYSDETTAIALQAQQDSVAELQAELEAAMDAETVDSTLVSDLRSQLRDARHDLRDDVKAVVSDSDELQTALDEARAAARAERAVTRLVLSDEETYSSIVTAATDEQAVALAENQAAITALQADIDAAKDAGASRSEVHTYRDELRALVSAQSELVSTVLDTNEELSTEVTAAAEAAATEARATRENHRGHHGGRGRH